MYADVNCLCKLTSKLHFNMRSWKLGLVMVSMAAPNVSWSHAKRHKVTSTISLSEPDLTDIGVNVHSPLPVEAQSLTDATTQVPPRGAPYPSSPRAGAGAPLWGGLGRRCVRHGATGVRLRSHVALIRSLELLWPVFCVSVVVPIYSHGSLGKYGLGSVRVPPLIPKAWHTKRTRW